MSCAIICLYSSGERRFERITTSKEKLNSQKWEKKSLLIKVLNWDVFGSQLLFIFLHVLITIHMLFLRKPLYPQLHNGKIDASSHYLKKIHKKQQHTQKKTMLIQNVCHIFQAECIYVFLTSTLLISFFTYNQCPFIIYI